MRATVAGRVLGTAMESMNLDNTTDCPAGGNGGTDAKCGQITVFVNLADYQGMSVESLMNEVTDNNLSVDDNAVSVATDSNSPFANYAPQAKVLDFLENLKKNQSKYSAADILAGNINAVGQVVSPLIVTDTLIAKNIKAENIEGLQFIQTGIQTAQDGVAVNTTQVQSLGQQITDLQSLVKNLSDKSSGLTVGGPAEFQGPAIFKAMAQFIDKVIFRNNVEFAGQVTFNQDTAGYAIIKEGNDNVIVNFAQEYTNVPVVNASISLQQIEDSKIRKASEDLLLLSDVRFIITNVTTKGFEIKIPEKTILDIPFSWTAISVNDAKTFSAGDDSSVTQTENKSGDIIDTPDNISADSVTQIEKPLPPVSTTAPATTSDTTANTVSTTESGQGNVSVTNVGATN